MDAVLATGFINHHHKSDKSFESKTFLELHAQPGPKSYYRQHAVTTCCFSSVQDLNPKQSTAAPCLTCIYNLLLFTIPQQKVWHQDSCQLTAHQYKIMQNKCRYKAQTHPHQQNSAWNATETILHQDPCQLASINDSQGHNQHIHKQGTV